MSRTAPSKLALVCGTPGADTQVQTNFQMVTHVLDFGMNVAEAVEAPPVAARAGRHGVDDPAHRAGRAAHGSRFPGDVLDGLRGRGHPVTSIGDWAASRSE